MVDNPNHSPQSLFSNQPHLPLPKVQLHPSHEKRNHNPPLSTTLPLRILILHPLLIQPIRLLFALRLRLRRRLRLCAATTCAVLLAGLRRCGGV